MAQQLLYLTLGQRWDEGGSRGNNLDFVRFVAASLVIFSHAFGITNGSLAAEPLYWFTNGATNIGTLSVLVFFAISGFLITYSWEQKPILLVFLWRRFLRLFPGLFVATLLTIAVLGPLMTTLSWQDYWAHPDTWAYAINATTFNKWDSLPGVFANNPEPFLVNSSLWTLKFEVMCYMSVAALGILGLLRGRFVLVMLLATIITSLVLGDAPTSGLKFYLQQFSLLAQAFFAGSVLCLWRNNVPLSKRLAALCATIIVLSVLIGQINLAVALAGAYLTMWFAFVRFGKATRVIRKWGISGDFSYGLYVYGFPIQQIVQAVLQPDSPYVNFLLAWPMALLLAFLSWDRVEAGALQAKRWIERQKTTREQAANTVAAAQL